MATGSIIVLVLALICFLLLFGLFWFFVRKLLSLLKLLVANSVVGLTIAVILGLLGVKIPLTTATIVVIALFGLGGLGSLLTLLFFGVKLG
ncbi:MAG: hypothetical protein WC759_04590 [Candidatus Micrarchaeia archaeon]|jgi:hypothetical protein